jgi:hypothetical protein
MGGWDAIPNASQQGPEAKGWDAIPNSVIEPVPSHVPGASPSNLLVPVSSHEPAPFPIDDHINQQIKDLPPDQESEVRSGWHSVLHQLARPYLATGYTAESSLNRGMAHFVHTLDTAKNWLAETEGPLTKVYGFRPTKGGFLGDDFFENLAKAYEGKADYWKKRADQVGVTALEEMLGEAVGGAAPGSSEFLLDIASGLTLPAIVGQKRAEERGEHGGDTIIAGLVEAAKVGTLQYLFRSVAPFKRYIQATALGTYFGAEAAADAPAGQKMKAFAQGAGTGMLLGATNTPGEMGVRDLYPELASSHARATEPISMPPEPMPEPLRPAIKTPEGVTAGKPGETHADIEKRMGPEYRMTPEGWNKVDVPQGRERGFQDPQGNLLTRKEAELSVEQREPEVYEEWKRIAGEGAELHSQDYNRARATVEASRRPLPLGAASALPMDNTPVFQPRVEPTGIWGAVGKVFHNMYKATTIDILPNLTDAGVSNNGVQTAAARVAVPKIVDDFLSKVFPEDYKKPEKMAPFIDILNKDNILGGYDSFLKNASEARIDGDDALARKWDRLAYAVKKAHNLPAYEAEVKKSMGNKKFMETVARWQTHVVPKLDQMYNEMKQVDAYTQRESRGRFLDSRINLLSEDHAERWTQALGDADKPIPEASASSYRNPNVKRDPTDLMAHFTSKYSTDARAVLSNVVSHRWQEVTKLRFYNDLVDNGVAIKAKSGEEAPEGYSRMPFKIPKTNANGVTSSEEQALFVPQNLVREIRSVLGTDMAGKQNIVFKALTNLQLAQLADLTTHTKNIVSVVTRAQGAGDVWTDLVRKFPGIGSATAIHDLAVTTREVLQDTPEIRAEEAWMAQRGLLRPEFPSTGLQKITRGQAIIHQADTAARIIMNRRFNTLVERGPKWGAQDTEENRRNFINQVGEYNSRLQGPMMKWAKEHGISPFITAGRNFNRQGRWALTGNPGVQMNTMQAAVQMRVTNLLGTAMLFTVPMWLNYLTTGKVAGRAGTPLGAWDYGGKVDENGKHQAIDLLKWTGVRRGMKSIGLDAFAKGLQNGDNMNDIVGNALQDAGNTIIHPWNGPGIALLEKTATGKQFDLRGKMEAEQLPEGGGLQFLENFRAALESANPLAYSIVRPAFQGAGLDQKIKPPYGEDVVKTLLKSPAQAVGLIDITPPPTEMERLKRDIGIKRARMKKDIEYQIGIDRKAQKKKFTLLKRRAVED